MSFRELGQRQNQYYRRASAPTMPRITAEEEITTKPPRTNKKPLVLHGKVQNTPDADFSLQKHRVQKQKEILQARMANKNSMDDENSNISSWSDDDSSHIRHTQSLRSRRLQAAHQRPQHRSTFGQLTLQTQKFAKMVADLEQVLKQARDSPEHAWRAQILVRSVQETEQDLWHELYAYERRLTNPVEQTACLKLHRDFKRSHKALTMALSLHEQQQKADVAVLHAVGWSEKPDFFDQAMKERELENINQSMHKVNDICKELAELVDSQQDEIDTLERNTSYARSNVQAGWNNYLSCLSESRFSCGSDWSESLRGLDLAVDDRQLGSWYQTFREDMGAVSEDLAGLGRSLFTKTQ